MIFDDAVAAALTAPATLPRITQEARLTLRYAAGVSATDEAAAFADLLGVLLPLYRAGFLSATGAPAPDLALDVSHETAQSATFALTGLAHTPVALHGLLRLVGLTHQTQPGAFDQLVQMLGSVAEAEEIFVRRDFSDVITAVTLSAKGVDAVPFADPAVARPAEYASLVAKLGAVPRDVDLHVNRPVALPGDLDNAFLTAHNTGLFGPVPPLSEPEPEIWTTPQGDGVTLHIRDYAGDASYLAELVFVMLNADLSAITGVDPA